jgi:eukaryotic-like serine/threonine-protein kinase
MQNPPAKQPSKTEREIFLEALERSTPEERAAFLDVACANNPSLRAGVEALLGHVREDRFLETPVVDRSGKPGESAKDAVTVLAGEEKPGDQVGRYKLLQQIGEGGVGIVFMAEQVEPVRRRVAVKLLRPGMDTKSVIARFESERQALALMDHPNIARVLDAGSTEKGRPYFVMELVRGIRITDYCDQNNLPTRDRLELFIQVCQAIQHAHQKGIIHRDIKPSNILVTLHDGVPVPKVIDFGIAKASDQRLTDKTQFTQFQAFIGTPAYISPEQAEMSGLDIDTRTDIYSLGVLLYELLTGRTPFDPQALVASGLDGMRKTIREQDPMPPSTRLRTMLDGERTTTARRQQMEPAKLGSLLRGDLDWIVLKSLEKDRTRRYETANAMAMDVRRFLQNEPVQARPPSRIYRFQKLVRRNKLPFTAAAAFAIALIAGLTLSTWQFLEKSVAYQRAVTAEQEQSRLRLEAEQARLQAEEQALASSRRAYAADMRLVEQALEANNLGRAQDLLQRYRPIERAGNGVAVDQLDLRGWEWRYLWRQARSDALFTLCQLTNEVFAIEVSHDGRWAALGERGNGGLSIWDLRARQELARFPAVEGRDSFAFSPVAPLLAFSSFASPDEAAPSPRPLPPEREDGLSTTGARPGLANAGSSMAIEPYSQAGFARQAGGRIRLWDFMTRRVVGDFPLPGPCQALAFSADGTKLLAAVGHAGFILWSVPDGIELARVPAVRPDNRSGMGGAAAISPDLSLAARALGEGRLHVVDIASGRELWTAEAADEYVLALAFSPDATLLASAAGFVESAIRLWDVASGKEVARLDGHRTYVRSLQFWPDGETLASASGDQTILLWDVGSLRFFPPRSGSPEAAQPRPHFGPFPRHPRMRVAELQPFATLRGHRTEVWSVALAPDSTTLISGGKDGEVCVWDTTTLRHEPAHVTLPVPVRTWSFAPDGSAIYALEHNGRVSLWTGTDLQSSQTLLQLDAKFADALLSPEGRLAVRTAEGTIQVWDLQPVAMVQEFTAADRGASLMSFLKESDHLVTKGTHTPDFHNLNVKTGVKMESWAFTQPAGLSVNVISLDGRWLAGFGSDGTGSLRNTDTGHEQQLTFDPGRSTHAAFSPDSRWLAAVNGLGNCHLWDTTTGQKPAILRGFLQGMHSVGFSPDGQRLAIGSNGNEAVKLWDLNSLEELLTLKGQGSMFDSVTFSPDGNLLASTNARGILHVWRAPSFDEIAQHDARSK